MKSIPDVFNAKSFVPVALQSNGTDEDWMAVATRVPTAGLGRGTAQGYFIPAIPYSFLTAISPAADAVTLLLFALARMRMLGVNEIAIGQPLWKLVGNPTKRVRARLLQQISKLPNDICMIISRRGRPHLLVTGVSWPQKITRVVSSL